MVRVKLGFGFFKVRFVYKKAGFSAMGLYLNALLLVSFAVVVQNVKQLIKTIITR